MIKTDDVKKHLNAAEVANLPETLLRAEAACYDILDEILAKFPSAEEMQRYSGNYREIEFSLNPRTYSADTPSEVSVELHFRAPFDEVMSHATDLDIEKVRWSTSRKWMRRGVQVVITADVTAPLDEEYKDTLRDLGKIHVHRPSGYIPPAQETIYCPLNKSDDIPF